MTRRQSGILLHPTSLPFNPAGVLGENAYRFVDLLHDSGQSLWQVLPLGPTHADLSPYQCLSVHAGNPLLIDMTDWLETGVVDEADIYQSEEPFALRLARSRQAIEKAYRGFDRTGSAKVQQELDEFIEQQKWLLDYALYMALKERYQGAAWYDWPEPIRNRDESALREVRQTLDWQIRVRCFEQSTFFNQWQNLKHYANEKGIELFGDMPIFVSHDSAEVWAHRECFKLDEQGHCRVVAGVPPDYFSETGQRWGNPHYDWQFMKQNDYGWWKERFRTQLDFFDLIRIDHFRGFQASWEILESSETAIDGVWQEGPGIDFFNSLSREFGVLPLVAEDLGLITAEVNQLREQTGFPGMKILQFAFDGSPDNPYLPHQHVPQCVVYTGTHDNDTLMGWFEGLNEEQRSLVVRYFGGSREKMPWTMIHVAMASIANRVIIPLQDIMGLGSEARMNTPGTPEGNWLWSFRWEQLNPNSFKRLLELTHIHGRCDAGAFGQSTMVDSSLGSNRSGFDSGSTASA